MGKYNWADQDPMDDENGKWSRDDDGKWVLTKELERRGSPSNYNPLESSVSEKVYSKKEAIEELKKPGAGKIRIVPVGGLRKDSLVDRVLKYVSNIFSKK